MRLRALFLVSVASFLATACAPNGAGPPTPTSSAPSPAPSTPAATEEAAAPTPAAESGLAAAIRAAQRHELDSPDELAEALASAELAFRSPDGPGEEAASLGHLQQAAYRQLVTRPEWMPAVLSAVPPEIRPAIEANVGAGGELRALTEPRTELPDWQIVSAPPADGLMSHYVAAEDAYGISRWYLAAVHLVETRMGRIRGTSTAGARGPMQFLPSTWEHWGEGDIEDAGDSILAAAHYLADHGGPQDMSNALYAYNHSQRYVRAVTAYAEQMASSEHVWLGYYHWQVYYRTTSGDALLEEGWGSGGKQAGS